MTENGLLRDVCLKNIFLLTVLVCPMGKVSALMNTNEIFGLQSEVNPFLQVDLAVEHRGVADA